MNGRPAVFLDRDGTLNEESGYIERRDRITLFPWTTDAVRLLNRAGFAAVVVSNQSGVARGYFTEAIVQDLHVHMTELLAQGGARIDAYYYCPHHPEGPVVAFARRCDCRKPRPGLVERAARDLDLDPTRSFVVGDRWLDVGLARAVGARAVLVRTGYGATAESTPPEGVAADHVADNLIDAVSWILRQRPGHAVA